MERYKMDLQLFNLTPGPAQGFSGGGPTNGGNQQSGVPGGEQGQQGLGGPTPGGQQAQQGQQQQGGRDDYYMRSVIQSAEQTAMQRFQQENAEVLEMAKLMQQAGFTPQAVVSELRGYLQQAQAQAQAQQAQGMGVSPQTAQLIQTLQSEIKELKDGFQKETGTRKFQEAESNTTNFLKGYGIEYTGENRLKVLQYAKDHNIGIEQAAKLAMFDNILQVNTQQAQGQALLALQGRGPQPVSSMVPGSSQQAPLDFRTMDNKTFKEHQQRMRAANR